MTKKNGILAMLGATLIAVGSALPGQSAENDDAPKHGIIVQQGELENGLEVYVLPDKRADVVTHMLWLRVGGADEPRGKSGIAHLFEHLMFKGTEKHAAGEFDKRIEEVGGQQNAFTSDDYTGYHQKVSSAHLAEMMELEADRLMGLTLSEEDVATESQVVVQERLSRVENDPGAQLTEALDSLLYIHHPYGTPVLGWQNEMESITREDALKFYREHYRPANAILIVAGNTTLDEVMAIARITYGKLPKGEPVLERKRIVEPEPRAERSLRLYDERVETPSWRRVFLVPSYNTAVGKEAFALDILSYILGGGRSSRLYKKLVLDEEKALSTGTWYWGGALDYSRFGLYAAPREGVDIAEVEALALAELQKILDEGVTEAEVENAKIQQLAAALFSQDDSANLARSLGSTLTTGGTVESFLSWPEDIKSVTPAMVQAAAKKYLIPRRSVSGYLLKEKSPAEIDVAKTTPEEGAQ